MEAVVALTVLFGKPGAAEAWVSEERLADFPPVGIPVRIRFQADHFESAIEGQVYRSWGSGSDDDPHGVLVYAGRALLDEQTRQAFEDNGWCPVSSDTAQWLAGVVHDSPTVANKHEVNLMVENGDGAVRLFRQVLDPGNPALPFFGQRMFADPLDFSEEELAFMALTEGLDIEDGDGGCDCGCEDGDDYAEGCDDDCDDDCGCGDISDAQWRENQEQDREEVDAAIGAGVAEDAHGKGLPVLVIYSSLIEPGLARLAFWTSGMGGITDDEMVASGWEIVGVDRFDPEEWGLRRRVELALATHVVYQTGPFQGFHLGDWWMDSPDLVGESDEPYLPPYLYELAVGVRQLDNVDTLVQEWGQAS